MKRSVWDLSPVLASSLAGILHPSQPEKNYNNSNKNYTSDRFAVLPNKKINSASVVKALLLLLHVHPLKQTTRSIVLLLSRSNASQPYRLADLSGAVTHSLDKSLLKENRLP